MPELAWRRRKRERVEREAVERRHRETLRATIVSAVIGAVREPELDGQGVFQNSVRRRFINVVMQGDILEQSNG